MQTWGFRIDVNVLDRIKTEFGCKVINIGMDEKHTFWVNRIPKDGTYGLINEIDLMLTSIPEAVDWFRKEGVPCFFFLKQVIQIFSFQWELEKNMTLV